MTINRVRIEPRAWEEAGEQLRDWVPVPVRSEDHGDIAIESWHSPDDFQRRFAFTRSDGVRLMVTEMGLADGLREIDPQLRRHTDTLTSARFVEWVSARGEVLGHAIFDRFDEGNPFRAEHVATDGAA